MNHTARNKNQKRNGHLQHALSDMKGTLLHMQTGECLTEVSTNNQSTYLNHHLNVMITCSISSKSKCILYAEDTSVIISPHGIDHFEKYLNDTSSSLNKWFKVNKPTLKLY